jgi:hypothetical protein
MRFGASRGPSRPSPLRVLRYAENDFRPQVLARNQARELAGARRLCYN